MSGPRTTPTVTKQEAAQMGLLTPDEQHTPAPLSCHHGTEPAQRTP
jgi:hypothetical protein